MTAAMSQALTVMLMTPYYPPHLGGVQVYVRNLGLGLAGLGCRVIVVTSGSVPGTEQDGPITVHRLRARLTFSATPVDPGWFGQVRELVRQERPDVINAHTPVPFLVDVAARVRHGVPLVVTYHAASLLKSDNPAFNALARVYAGIERRTLDRADTLIAVTDHIAELLRRRGLRPGVRVVPNSVWVRSPPPTWQVRAPGSAEVVFVGSLDRSHQWKGLGDLIRALGLHHRAAATPAVHLTVVGDGSHRARYEALARAEAVDGVVTFAGARYGADKDALIRHADLLVGYPTSSNDAFPTVFLEAWAEGTPVLASDISPMPAILRDGVDAVLVPGSSPPALARAIAATLADDALCRRLAANGSQRLRERHDWAVNARLTKEILERAAAREPSEGPRPWR